MEDDHLQDSSGFEVFTLVHIIEQLSRSLLERRLPDGLRVSHFGVLSHLARRGDRKTPLELSQIFQVTKGAMTKTLTRLEERRLVSIVQHPTDGRSKLVSITEKGLQVRKEAVQAVQSAIEEIKWFLDDGELEAALPFLRKLARILDENREF